MCDYSLTEVRSRPARKGETYVTHRFQTGAVGLVSPGDPTTAVCVAADTRLRIANLPDRLRSRRGIASDDLVTFVRLDGGFFRDGIAFGDGACLRLQDLPEGVTMTVEDTLEDAARLRGRMLIES
jgi:hypothetical protein